MGVVYKNMENTSKNFVLQLGALASLYVSLSALVAVIFGIINLVYPDAAEGYWAYEGAQGSIRFGLACLIVFFPVYLVLTRIVNQIRRKEHGVYLTLTRWLIYLSLFLGSAILLGDLVSVLWGFLNGELTVRFALKALALLIVIASALVYYILDIRGYWTKHEMYSRWYGAVATTAVVSIVFAGFFHIDTPSEVREQRLDNEQVTQLQDMQWRIEEFYRTNGSLPSGIDALYIDATVPRAPEDRASYEYTVTGAMSYELCATFAKPSTRSDSYSYTRPLYDEQFVTFSWEHEAGDVCFERSVAHIETEPAS